MKNFLLVIVILASFVSMASAKYTFKEAIVVGWAIATDAGEEAVNCPGFKNPYAVTVDGEGNIWFGAYYQRYWLDTDGVTKIWPDDISIVKEDTTIVKGTYPAFKLKTDGTVEVIQFLKYADGSQDTTWNSQRGMATLADGNIVFSTTRTIYKLNYQTNEVMAKWDVPGAADAGGPVGVETDAEGFIYVTCLSGGTPVWILDPEDLSIYNQVTDNAEQMQRNLAVSPDGKDVYLGAISGSNGALHFHSNDGVDGTYAVVDTILNQIVEISGTDTVTSPVPAHFCQMGPDGVLWVGTVEEAAKKILWGVDPATHDIVDSTSFIWWGNTAKTDTTTGNYAQPQYIRAPRDAAWSADGKLMYIADMYSYTIKVFEKEETSVPIAVATDQPVTFQLGQNYPNPFNPITTVPFSLDRTGKVELKVYNMLGREVMTVLNQTMHAGAYRVLVDASGLASGAYFYQLKYDNQVQTKQLILMK